MSAAPDVLTKGIRIEGKWTKQQWIVCSRLGIGANGTVYAVQRIDGELGAMKVCPDAGSVAFEWGLLEKMAAAGAAFPKPHCIDDSVHHAALYFYVMEQIQGRPLADIWGHLSEQQRKRVLLGILYGLRELHRAKHAFCDIKPQNILVDLSMAQAVRFVDVGGVTAFGRSVRQFTPTSDVAYWGLGERRANEQYDLAAVALMFVCLEHPLPPNLSQWPAEKRQAWMLRAIRNVRNSAWRLLLDNAVTGSLASADEFLRQAYRLPTDTMTKMPAGSSSRVQRGTPTTVRYGLNTMSVAKGQQRDWTAKLMWWSLASACLSTVAAWAVYFRVI